MPNLQLEIQGKGSLPSGEGAGKACGGCRNLRPMGRLQSPQHVSRNPVLGTRPVFLIHSYVGEISDKGWCIHSPCPVPQQSSLNDSTSSVQVWGTYLPLPMYIQGGRGQCPGSLVWPPKGTSLRPLLLPRAPPLAGPHLLRQRAPWDRRPASSPQQLDLLQGRVVLPPPRTHQREGGTPVHSEAGSVHSGHWRTTPHPARRFNLVSKLMNTMAAGPKTPSHHQQSRHFWSLPPRYAIQEDHEHNGVIVGKTEDVSPCQRKVMESGGVVYMNDLPVYTQKRIVHHSALSGFSSAALDLLAVVQAEAVMTSGRLARMILSKSKLCMGNMVAKTKVVFRKKNGIF
ncbi:uncharacterized protein LOC125171728 [Prionailurus viverrinus]|uniref:uncharacterized protein LOC125171728 n=1 Tax=Prionailurus viverrinus TaxID=61388 RepID=UPI001FF12485|nr:uncharacterized protein LOC125171728 [Prionailurus viverrinus]